MAEDWVHIPGEVIDETIAADLQKIIDDHGKEALEAEEIESELWVKLTARREDDDMVVYTDSGDEVYRVPLKSLEALCVIQQS